jgi:hypothetical protein
MYGKFIPYMLSKGNDEWLVNVSGMNHAVGEYYLKNHF